MRVFVNFEITDRASSALNVPGTWKIDLYIQYETTLFCRQRSVSCYVMKRSSINEPSYSYQVSST